MSKGAALYFVFIGTILLTSCISDMFSLNTRSAGNVSVIIISTWMLIYTAIKYAITPPRSR